MSLKPNDTVPLGAFTTGAMWDEGEWYLKTDVEVSALSGGVPCPHCTNDHVVTHERYGDHNPATRTWTERVWTCPLVIVALNEGGCCSTGVCALCAVAAIQMMTEGK